MVDGASSGLGYATADSYVTSRGDREEGTAYVNYSYGPLFTWCAIRCCSI